MTTNSQTKQSASMQTQADSQQSLSAGRSASTRTLTDQTTAQYGAQSASQRATSTANSTRYSQKPSTNTLATEQEELELLAGMFNDLRKKFKESGLLTLRRALPTAQDQRGALHLVISNKLEDLMKGVNNE